MKERLLHIFFFIGVLYSVAQKTPVVFQEDTSVEEALIKKLLDSASANYAKGNYIASLRFNIEVINKATEINNSKLISKGYRYLAYDYLSINDTLLARQNFEKSKKFAERTNNKKRLGESFMDLGNFYSSAYSNYKTASQYYDKALVSFKEVKDTVSLTKLYMNYILNVWRAENYKKVPSYLQVLEQPSFSKFLSEDIQLDIDSYWGGYYLYHEKDPIKANEYFLKIIPIAKEKKYYNILAELYYDAAESFYIQKKYKEASEYHKKYIDVNDINTQRRTEAISESVSSKFKIEQYQQNLKDAEEKTKLQEEIASNKNILSNVLIVVCSLGLFLLLFLFKAYVKRKDLNNALLEKNKEYLDAKRKSDHLTKAKSKFFSTVSHELRTPLYGVIGLSTILLENEKLKEHQKDLKSLKFSADYLLALINDVLQINKIDAKNVAHQIAAFNLRELIRSIEISFEYIRLQNNNTIVLNIAPETPNYIVGNNVRLSQILMNLVGNACKFTEDGTITITINPVQLNENKATLYFSVKDTGIGIAKDKQAYMFDEFTQIENLDYTYQGTGLGLPIVKKLLALSNAEIKLESDLGNGAEFSFTLDYEIAKDLNAEKESQVIDLSVLNGKKILVAEDNRINQIVTKKILESRDIICSIANNGEEAISLAKEYNYDLILMDLNMPVKNGFDAAIAIRKFNDKIPIIALTAVEIEEVKNEINFSGMDDIIIKPYDTEKFIGKLIENMHGVRKQIRNHSKKAI